MKEVLRQEKKYVLSIVQAHSLDAYFAKLLHRDEYSIHQGYLVRSLYFDSMQDMDFEDKEDGVEKKKKLRLRLYHPEDSYAFLEMKQKQGNMQKKQSLKLKKEDAQALIRGQYECLLTYEDSFAKECYALMQMYAYRPKAIVEYRRIAYVANVNKTRITFDSNIQATESCFDLFSSQLNTYPVLDANTVIMEVKYNDFLLSYIKDIMSVEGKNSTSVSKYSLSRSISKHFLF